MTTSYKSVKVPLFCELCGKEEFEGTIWGKDFTRHLRMVTDVGMICDHCLDPSLVVSQKVPAHLAWCLVES